MLPKEKAISDLSHQQDLSAGQPSNAVHPDCSDDICKGAAQSGLKLRGFGLLASSKRSIVETCLILGAPKPYLESVKRMGDALIVLVLCDMIQGDFTLLGWLQSELKHNPEIPGRLGASISYIHRVM